MEERNPRLTTGSSPVHHRFITGLSAGREAGNGHRRELGDHDVVGEVDAGGLEHTLSTQVVGNVKRDDVSVPPLDGEARPLLIASILLPSLLAILLTPEGDPVQRLYSTTNFRTLTNCRQRSTIRKIVREPERTHRRA